MTHDSTLRDFVLDLYSDLGDRAAFDRRLHPDVTVWETPRADLMRGIAELDELRGPARAPGERRDPLPDVRPVQIVTDRYDDTGLIRYVLEVRDPSGGELLELVRVTDVLRRDGTGWRIVHHHAQDLALPAPRPSA
ncbi:nuclear transport factor 2 family protein [Herbiconiux sp. A18JL235]|uniref:Nuclear transport factor 2 family protein n=1 Tax=Herbiconiux sp. A18JL235 TaxID=3152363 RepID=A0AB39BJG7_9MICO